MKSLIKKLLREGLLKEGLVTSRALKSLENELDELFANIGIDIEFTKHFFERVNDKRNGRDITVDELRSIFKDVYSQYKDRLKKYGDGFEAVFKNRPTNINIPFVLNWDAKNKEVDLVTKTIMRKKDFKTTTLVLPVSGEAPKAPEQRTDKFKKLKLNNGQVIRHYELLNKFTTLSGEEIQLDDIFDELPEELQNRVMELMESIEIPVEVGDTVLMGRFKNKKVIVKDIEWDEEKGDLTINGKPALKMRIINKEKEKDN